jgi:uncharacterized protein YdhG (YjbR/CyaY superfamily)
MKMILTSARTPDDYVSALSGWQQAYVIALRAAVRAAAPALREQLKWGHLVYLQNGPVLLLRAEPSRVLFGFWRGRRLRDIEPRLKPGGKFEMATLSLGPDTPLRRETVVTLVRTAARLDREQGDPTGVAPGEPVGDYIRGFPAPVQVVLRAVRAAARAAAPEAEERISYRMPALFQDGVLLYYAAFKKHIGLFPPVADPALRLQAARYMGPKGNLQLPLNEPMPLALIGAIVRARLQANRSKAAVTLQGEERRAWYGASEIDATAGSSLRRPIFVTDKGDGCQLGDGLPQDPQ